MTTIAIVIVGRAITLWRSIKKRSKELIPKVKYKILRAITLHDRSNIEKANIVITILEKKNNWMAP